MASKQDSYPGYLPLRRNEDEGASPDAFTVAGINGHIHSPYSFSAFSSMEQPFRMAKQEGISVLGINDFYTTDGYTEFADLALHFKVFPLFNIEFMALQKEEQQSGMRVNDPVNPGRTYLSGKGLRFPVRMSLPNQEKLAALQRESNLQTYQMVDRLNQFLVRTTTGLQFDASEMQAKLARNLLRERHIATAVRIALFEKFRDEAEITEKLTEIFGGKAPKSPFGNFAGLENEIRNNLLKSGGPAYVPEDEKAFLNLEEVTGLISDAGGIPCYPVLLDDVKGNFTDFESDWERMASLLLEKGIYMVELIPGRNDYAILKKFISFFHSRGFVITFGTEHNTPQLDPLTVSCRGGVPLDEELLQINTEGAAIIAAHQYLTANEKTGFPVRHFPTLAELKKLENLGKNVINRFTRP
jgi:hypothetical protein